ncbi:MAG: hypothetical protein U0324_07040 [Polyangiales bacterium]
MKHVDIVYFDVTSGHRSAAQAILRALARRDGGLDVRLVNLVDALSGDRRLQGLARGGIDAFNWCMRRELPLFQRQQIGFFQALQRALPPSAQAHVGGFWRRRPVDLVASVTPICNGFLQRALHTARPAAPYVVVPVDLTEGKARYWFEPDIDAHYLNPTERLMEQCRAAGVAEARATAVRGMPVDPAFYDHRGGDRAEVLARLGLDPSLLTVLVSFGGQGSVLVERCARALRPLGAGCNVIFLCGRDEAGRARVERLEAPYRKCALGFTEEPPAAWYGLADVVVGKPGSMTLTEAIVMRKPLVALRSGTLAVVQRGNEEWIERAGVGAVVELDGLADAVRRLHGSAAVRAAIDRHWHRGVEEIAAHLLRLGGHPAARGGATC